MKKYILALLMLVSPLIAQETTELISQNQKKNNTSKSKQMSFYVGPFTRISGFSYIGDGSSIPNHTQVLSTSGIELTFGKKFLAYTQIGFITDFNRQHSSQLNWGSGLSINAGIGVCLLNKRNVLGRGSSLTLTFGGAIIVNLLNENDYTPLLPIGFDIMLNYIYSFQKHFSLKIGVNLSMYSAFVWLEPKYFFEPLNINKGVVLNYGLNIGFVF
ncbi:MAG: hypothetical protein ACRCV0_02435 [Brevinema sp.]